MITALVTGASTAPEASATTARTTCQSEGWDDEVVQQAAGRHKWAAERAVWAPRASAEISSGRRRHSRAGQSTRTPPSGARTTALGGGEWQGRVSRWRCDACASASGFASRAREREGGAARGRTAEGEAGDVVDDFFVLAALGGGGRGRDSCGHRRRGVRPNEGGRGSAERSEPTGARGEGRENVRGRRGAACAGEGGCAARGPAGGAPGCAAEGLHYLARGAAHDEALHGVERRQRVLLEALHSVVADQHLACGSPLRWLGFKAVDIDCRSTVGPAGHFYA